MTSRKQLIKRRERIRRQIGQKLARAAALEMQARRLTNELSALNHRIDEEE